MAAALVHRGDDAAVAQNHREPEPHLDEHLAGRFDLEVVDIYQQPELAEENQVVAAPTLLKLLPPPLRRIIGDLSDEGRVLRALELTPAPPQGGDGH